MLVRRYASENIFIETEVLAQAISESERERLYFDLLRGNGEYIEDAAGLKTVRCGPYGHYGKEGREVVFAEYPYPDIKKRIFLLLNEFPLSFDRALTEEEKGELHRLKAKADRYIERFCESLQDEEPSS